VGGGARFLFKHSNTRGWMLLTVLVGRGRTYDAASHNDEVKS
jgi:hypothetical protein